MRSRRSRARILRLIEKALMKELTERDMATLRRVIKEGRTAERILALQEGKP